MIDSRGPQIGSTETANLEVELGALLPSSYREFLLRYNGRAPTPDAVDIPGAPGTPTDLQVVFGIGRTIKSSNLSWNLALIRERCPR